MISSIYTCFPERCKYNRYFPEGGILNTKFDFNPLFTGFCLTK